MTRLSLPSFLPVTGFGLPAGHGRTAHAGEVARHLFEHVGDAPFEFVFAGECGEKSFNFHVPEKFLYRLRGRQQDKAPPMTQAQRIGTDKCTEAGTVHFFHIAQINGNLSDALSQQKLFQLGPQFRVAPSPELDRALAAWAS